jgi:hypothetical protein
MLFFNEGKKGIRLIDGIKILPLKILRKWSLSLQFDVCHLIVSFLSSLRKRKHQRFPGAAAEIGKKLPVVEEVSTQNLIAQFIP